MWPSTHALFAALACALVGGDDSLMFTYMQPQPSFRVGVAAVPDVPLVSPISQQAMPKGLYAIAPSLPKGLRMGVTDGVIRGVPRIPSHRATYTVWFTGVLPTSSDEAWHAVGGGVGTRTAELEHVFCALYLIRAKVKHLLCLVFVEPSTLKIGITSTQRFISQSKVI